MHNLCDGGDRLSFVPGVPSRPLKGCYKRKLLLFETFILLLNGK